MVSREKHQPVADAEKDRPATEAVKDELLELTYTPITIGVKDPAEDPEGWDICRDFIDPLADELEEWREDPDGTVEDLMDFDVGMNDAGPDACINAWRRARIEFATGSLGDLRKPLEECVRRVAKESSRTHALLARFSEEEAEDQEETEDWEGTAIMEFEHAVVEPCLQYLREISRAIRKRVPLPKQNRKKRCESGGKNKGGRPPLSDAEVRRRWDIQERWKRAKGAGVRQKDFAGDECLARNELTRVLNWCSTQKRREATSVTKAPKAK